ncbi:MAG: hypothetical protein ACD_39C02064G0001 [uncultured bacterium]|nr:MAG: hypothetical protein ACD_39C02064G0001 [uncultured bacterium]
MDPYTPPPPHSRAQLIQISQAGIFLAVLLAVQLLSLPNPVTGIMVNALLTFVLLHLGTRYALMLAILSPVGGIISGHLPAPLYPLLPVIMCGNILMLAGYSFMRKLPALGRYFVPAALKGTMIWGAGNLIIEFLKIEANIQWLILPVLGIQFFTAALGLLAGEKLFLVFNWNLGRQQP